MATIDDIAKDLRQILKPPPDLTVSEWADKHRKLSSEASAEPGQWRTSRAPHQEEMMNAVNDPNIKQVVIMTSSQVGKTEILLNLIGYYVNYDPSPILILQPTLEMAQTFSKDRLSPMVRDTHCLHGKIADNRTRTMGTTLLHKTFPGGHITMAGANSAASLASRPIRVLLCDEVDRYPASAGHEGDPVNLAKKRTTTFWNRKIVLVSTPTITGESRIEKAYEDSTQERYCLYCPSCGTPQQILHKHIIHKKSQGNLVGAVAQCEACEAKHSEREWKKQPGVWVAAWEGVNTRGFHLNEYVSPWKTWLEIEQEFLLAKNVPEMLKTWINTSMGETFNVSGDAPDWTEVKNRCGDYNPDSLPSEAVFLTCGADVGKRNIHWVIRAWAKGYKSWLVDYGELIGDTSKPEVWEDLAAVIERQYSGLEIVKTLIDSGYRADRVYEFCRSHRRCAPTKGHDTLSKPFYASTIDVNIKGKVYKRGLSLWHFDTDHIKTWLYDQIKMDENDKWFVPFDVEDDYCQQITAETRSQTPTGKVLWKRQGANHYLDCEVLTYLGARISGRVARPGAKARTRKTKRKNRSKGVEL